MAKPQKEPKQENVIIPPMDDDQEPQMDEPQEPLNTLDKIESEIAAAKQAGAKRIRYSEEQKSTILQWISDYDSTHGRGGASQVANRLGISPISISQWKGKDGQEPKARKPRTLKVEKAEVVQTENPKIALLRVLRGRGFSVSASVNILDPQQEPEITVEESIKKVLDFVPFYNSNGKFEIGLNQLLEMLGLPLDKNKE